MKDKDFIKDYYYDEEYRLEHQPDSYLSIIHPDDNYNLSLLVQKRMNRFFTVTERLPEAEFNLRKTKIADTPFYFDNKTSFSNLTRKFADSSLDHDAFRLDIYNEASYPFSLLERFNIEPWTGIRQTYYTKKADGQEDITRDIFYAGIDSATKLYKIYDIKSNFLNLDINKLRHIITPTIEYKYIHKPTVTSDELMNFDSIDAIARTSLVTLGVENRLQTKREENEVDLGYFRTTIDYSFKSEMGGRWENLKGDLELTPYDWLYLEADYNYNPKAKEFEIINLDSVLKREKYEFGVGHRYQQESSSLATAQFKYYINREDENWKKRWVIDTYCRFEAKTKEWEEIQIRLTKDLHCWLADFIYNYRDSQGTESEENHTFYIVFRLKAFPKIPIKLFETSYEEPKPNR